MSRILATCFCTAYGLWVELKIRIRRPPNGMALARISDTGKGMSQDRVTRIFDEGARDGGAGAPRGTGMGLYIAKVLTELHGGTIKVESEPGEGSVFSVALPFERPKN